ncbi:MAG: uroporphyrinogen decarboxylase family protein [Chloroflexota bacterium]|nr:uroporphyrinogen decarboxylase family protein [Chloroflexota bacterium]
METLTGRERIANIIQHQPVDRIGVFEHFWDDTPGNWREAGHIGANESMEDHFDLDMALFWSFNFVADLDFEPELLSETDTTYVQRDGNGAVLRWHKVNQTTPEHVDYLVRDRQSWETYAKPRLTTDPRRIDFEGYRMARRQAAEADRFFCWSGVNVFELMHPVVGHENLLIGMALDPDWIGDMVAVYSQVTIELQEMLFAQEGYPDGIWYYEDMGFKQHPFFSPHMYRSMIQPGHIRTIDWAHGKGLPVIMHSCGYIAPLLPDMIEAGVDCLQVIEVKAGMDLLELHRAFGQRLSLMGGMDVRVLYTNDEDVIAEELKSKIPVVKEGFGYVLHSDHSIPVDVSYDSYRYFLDRGKELGSYEA